METMNDCLVIMMGSPDEKKRWEALATFLRELALSQGVDLDQPFKDRIDL